MFLPVIKSVPDELEVSGSAPNFKITIPLAAGEDGLQWVAVEARLFGCHWRGVAGYEFKFAIIVFDEGSDKPPAEIFDRFMAAAYVEHVRPLVMPCVCRAAEKLTEAVQPDFIYRATYVTRPDEKSLPKHQMITDTIAGMGYRVAQSGMDVHNRLFWLMIRNGDE